MRALLITTYILIVNRRCVGSAHITAYSAIGNRRHQGSFFPALKYNTKQKYKGPWKVMEIKVRICCNDSLRDSSLIPSHLLITLELLKSQPHRVSVQKRRTCDVPQYCPMHY